MKKITIKVNLNNNSYPIIICKNLLDLSSQLISFLLSNDIHPEHTPDELNSISGLVLGIIDFYNI